jgi:hypothetical protein
MEKLFEVLEAMFNWSFKLRRRLEERQIAIEKNEVSKLKEGYMQATNGMPGNPQTLQELTKTVRE